jgi:endonuclease III
MNAGQYNNLAQEMRTVNQRLGEIVLLLGEINGRMSKEINTPIPDDFPGVKVLHEAGIVYLETVPRDRDELLALDGIGPKTADMIAEALG